MNEVIELFAELLADIDSEPFAHEDFWTAAGARGE